MKNKIKNMVKSLFNIVIVILLSPILMLVGFFILSMYLLINDMVLDLYNKKTNIHYIKRYSLKKGK